MFTVYLELDLCLFLALVLSPPSGKIEHTSNSLQQQDQKLWCKHKKVVSLKCQDSVSSTHHFIIRSIWLWARRMPRVAVVAQIPIKLKSRSLNLIRENTSILRSQTSWELFWSVIQRPIRDQLVWMSKLESVLTQNLFMEQLISWNICSLWEPKNTHSKTNILHSCRTMEEWKMLLHP